MNARDCPKVIASLNAMRLQRYAKDTKFLERDNGMHGKLFVPPLSVAIWNRNDQFWLQRWSNVTLCEAFLLKHTEA